jgi:Co/Zn/Cd efflux system component
VAVIAAALAVSGTVSVWPDLVVALVMSMLALSAARSVIAQAREEIASVRLRSSAGHALASIETQVERRC